MTIRDKITPGPWASDFDDNGFYAIIASDQPHPYIAATCLNAPVSQHNALVISKVPEMLKLIERLTSTEDLTSIIHDAHELLEELNNKDNGE